MIGSIRKHSKWLWAIVVVAVIASFVIWTDVSPGRSLDFGGSDRGRMYGRPITRAMVVRANEAAEITEILNGGRGRENDKERQRLEYLLLQEKIREYAIHPGDDAVGRYLRENFKDPKTGAFSYDTFVQNLRSRTPITEAQFIEHVRQQVAVQHLMEVVSAASKLVTPREAEADFRRENEQVVVTAALFGTSNLLAGVVVDATELARFYTNRLASYRTPEKTILMYARFDATNHAAAAEAEMVKDLGFTNRFEQYYAQRGADAFRDQTDKVMTKEAALRKLREETVTQIGTGLARQAAIAFNEELANLTNVNPSSFALVAAKLGVPLRSTPPFRAGDAPPGLEDIPSIAQRAAALSGETPYTEPLDGNGYVAIPILQARIPAETPTLDTVRERVTRDFRRDKARAAAREAGEKFQASAAAAPASGRKFAEIAAEAGARVVDVPPFSVATETLPGLDPRLNLYSLKNAAFALRKGETGRYTETSDGGFVPYLVDRLPVADATVKAGLNGALEQARKQRQMAAFQAWFGAEFQKSGLAARLRPETPGLPGAGR